MRPPPLRAAQGRDGEGSGLYRVSHRSKSKSTPPRPSPSPAAKGRGQSACLMPSLEEVLICTLAEPRPGRARGERALGWPAAASPPGMADRAEESRPAGSRLLTEASFTDSAVWSRSRAPARTKKAPQCGAFRWAARSAVQRFIELKNSSLDLVFFILSSMNSIAAISSIGCSSLRRIQIFCSSSGSISRSSRRVPERLTAMAG